MPLADWKGLGSTKAYLLDVREPDEFARGHLEGATNVPLTQLRKRIGEVPRDREVWVYCAAGQRAYFAQRLLRQRGFRGAEPLGRLQHVARLGGGGRRVAPLVSVEGELGERAQGRLDPDVGVKRARLSLMRLTPTVGTPCSSRTWNSQTTSRSSNPYSARPEELGAVSDSTKQSPEEAQLAHPRGRGLLLRAALAAVAGRDIPEDLLHVGAAAGEGRFASQEEHVTRRHIGLSPSGRGSQAGGQRFAPASPPSVRLFRRPTDAGR